MFYFGYHLPTWKWKIVFPLGKLKPVYRLVFE